MTRIDNDSSRSFIRESAIKCIIEARVCRVREHSMRFDGYMALSRVEIACGSGSS